MYEPQLFDEQVKELNFDNLVEGYDGDDSLNPLCHLLNPDTSNWHNPQRSELNQAPFVVVPDTSNTTNSQPAHAQGNKRARANEGQFASNQIPGCSGLVDVSAHAQNAPKKAKSSITVVDQPQSSIVTSKCSPFTNDDPRNDYSQPAVQSTYVEPCGSADTSYRNLSLGVTFNSQNILLTPSGLGNASQGGNNLGVTTSEISSSEFSSQNNNNSAIDFAEAFAPATRNNELIFTAPVFSAPEMTDPSQLPDAALYLLNAEPIQTPVDCNRFGGNGLLLPFQETNSFARMPMFLPQLSPSSLIREPGLGVNQADRIYLQSSNSFQPPQEARGVPHILVPSDTSPQTFLPQLSPSSPIREPGLGVNQADRIYLQSSNSFQPPQEARGVPHILVPSDTSPQTIDAISPMSSSSAGYNSSRPPRSPKSQHVTRATTANAFCEVLNPRREYDKNQKKFLQGPRRSEQRIQCGLVRLKILSKTPLGDPPVNVFVRREPSAAQKQYQEHPEQFTMEQTRILDVRTWLNEECVDMNYSYSYNCELDLDSVYLTDDGKEVYKLVKSKGAINNLFQLCLVLLYNNGYQETLMPYEFVLKSGRTPAQQEHQMGGASGIRETTTGPTSHVSCKYLQAETAKITNIHCEFIQTENHDIAYFMKVRCDDENKPTDLEKGDVVAFLEDDEGDTYIDFLTSENAKEARLAGVISRTAFFRGRRAICDPDHVDSDLVCIIGEVDVKVHGKVHAGDLIYTSNCLLRRGTAVARNPLEPEMHNDDSARPTLLGMAMESYDDVDIKLARCLVSIVLGISDLHQRQTLQELRNCNDKIVQMQKCLKGAWKKTLLVFLFFLVTGTICYLFLAPNSPYLIMKCEEGCRKYRGSCLYLKFDYFPHESQESDEIVGINFKWERLKKKLDLTFEKCPNGTDLRYYLNKNRCVTGNIRVISSWLDTTPQVPRVNVLVVKSNCSHIFYYSARDGWVAYDEKLFKVKICENY